MAHDISRIYTPDGLDQDFTSARKTPRTGTARTARSFSGSIGLTRREDSRVPVIFGESMPRLFDVGVVLSM
eukprot:967588-Amorphochlora_amoeboformis.AAC.1